MSFLFVFLPLALAVCQRYFSTLADENGVSIKVAKYSGKTKVDLIQNEEYGYCSFIKATNQMLDKLAVENITMAKITSKTSVTEWCLPPMAD